MSQFAAIDLGSNSFRLHVGREDGDGGALRIVRSARDPVRLGAGLDRDGCLTEAAAQTALAALRRFAELLGGYRLDAVRAVATNTLRVARNAAAFLPRAEQALGYPIDVISGEEEGRLIYLGVAGALASDPAAAGRRLVIDIGGGSTELILGRGEEIEQVESFAIGTARQSLSFFGDGRIDAASFEAAILSARAQFEPAAALFGPERWGLAYGSSGTLRALGDAIARGGIGDGALELDGLRRLQQRLIACGRVDAVSLPGIKPERTRILVGGLAILLGLMRELGVRRIQPIDAGLRLGVLRDLQYRAGPGQRHDRRERAVAEFMERFGIDAARGRRVADSADALLRQLKPGREETARLLRWAALLHEAGRALSHSGYHKHSAYLIEHADLAGFGSRDQRAISLLALGQKGNLRKLGAALEQPDTVKAVLALRLAVMLAQARIDDPAGLRVRIKARIELTLPRAWPDLYPALGGWLRMEQEYWDEVGVDFTAALD